MNITAKIIGLMLIILSLGLGSCTQLTKPFTVEPPRPSTEQLSAAQSMTEKNIPVIINAQTDKQRKIASVARAALHALQAKGTDTCLVSGVENVATSAIEAIRLADGTAEILGRTQEKSIHDILQMPLAAYMAYAASQGVVASNNRELAYKGIKAGWDWTTRTISELAGGIGGGGGILYTFISMLSRRRKLLHVTGDAIEDFNNHLENVEKRPDLSEKLKMYLASAHSEVSINARKVFGLKHKRLYDAKTLLASTPPEISKTPNTVI